MIRSRRVVRIVNNLLISIFLGLMPVLGVVAPARAIDNPCGSNASMGNYKYWCYNGAGSSPTNFSTWCQPSGCTGSGSSLSGWTSPEYGYGYRNCTDYVAWKLNQVGTPISGGWGNGNQWDEHATGVYNVDTQPAVGAVAQWNTGSFGHVAYVEAYDSTTHVVRVSEYNYNLDGNYKNDRQFDINNSSSGRPEKYIHIEQGPLATAPGGWWRDPTPHDGDAALVNGIALSINVHGKDNSGSGLQKIDITWNMGSSGPWPKSTQPIYSSTTFDSDYSYYLPAPVGGWPNEVLISFDVYSNNGQVREAPQGIRRICKAGLSCSPINVPGQQGGGGGGSTGCVPGQYQAAVFMDPNYQGTCVIKGIGTYGDPTAIGLPNDSISSVKVGSGSYVTLCDNAGINTPCEWFTADDPDLYNNTINTNTVSSMRVEGGQPTTNCQPSDSEVAFFMDINYQGTCIIRGVGRYDNPGALGLPNDTISSVKLGARVNVRVCANDGNNSPCDQFESDVPNLGPTTVQDNTASSAEVTLKGGIALCDGTNGGGECRWFGAPDIGDNLKNMSDVGFDNRAESVVYDPAWANRYHIVLYTDQNQTGYLYHAENSVGDLGNPYDNNISSIKIYKIGLPGATALSPANDSNLPSSTTSVNLRFDGGTDRRVQVWNDNGYFFLSDWTSAATMTLNNLTPGSYHWQVQARSVVGEGQWTPVVGFNINTPPVVAGGSLTMTSGTTQAIQIQAYDSAQQAALELSVEGLPVFATFTDNGSGNGTLSFNPGAANAGTYTINVTAYDGEVTGSGTVTVQVVNPTPKTSTYAEDWSGGIDTTKWGNWGSPQTSVVAQQLKIASTTAPGYYGITSNNVFDLTGSYSMAQVANAGNQSIPSFEVYPVLVGPDSNNELSWYITGNSAKAKTKVNTVQTTLASVPYNSSTMKFFRIRESGGTVYWDYAANGNNWTNLASTVAPFDLTAVRQANMVGTWQTEASTTNAVFDNFNMVPQIATLQVGASSDDAEQLDNGAMSLTSDDLELTCDTTNKCNKNSAQKQTIGLRFAALPIPKNSSILSAQVEFTADEAQSEATSLTLNGQAADNASTFAATTNNISARTKTAASVAWSNLPAWVVGTKYQTPDMSPIVQEVVNRSGWASGNGLGLIVTGLGHRTADSYDKIGGVAPKLTVVYVAPASTTQSPAQPTFTGDGSVGVTSFVPGDTATANVSFTSTSSTNTTAKIHLEVRNPSDQTVYAVNFDNEAFTPGQTKNYPLTWVVPHTAALGNYVVKAGAVSSDWGTWYLEPNAIGQFAVVVPPPVVTDYHAEYFNNVDLSGTPVLTRDETAVNYDWGGGSPDPAVPSDNFSARWTKFDNFDAGTYTFTTATDDGVRLYIDNQPVIDRWVDQGTTSYTYSQNMTAGNHKIVMEYYERGGGAVARLNYVKLVASPTFQAEYYNNRSLSGSPVLTRAESAINYNWGGGSPDPSVPSDNFSARWTRIVDFAAGTYTFTMTGDDGVRLWIDDVMVIDRWVDQSATSYSTTQTLSAGLHNIKMEYYEAGGDAVAQLVY